MVGDCKTRSPRAWSQSRFRLTWEDLSAVNPRLIYDHLTGYGDAGEDADDPAFDALAYWARSGLMMSVTGLDGSPEHRAPESAIIRPRYRCSARSCWTLPSRAHR
jgi:crotonobetainyl-CoA:carnitine CoA-transferase CaiB-like acyl-CoA transferase